MALTERTIAIIFSAKAVNTVIVIMFLFAPLWTEVAISVYGLICLIDTFSKSSR